MIWTKKEKHYPSKGDTRERSWFTLIPQTWGNKIYWLEWLLLKQAYVPPMPLGKGEIAGGGWVTLEVRLDQPESGCPLIYPDETHPVKLPSVKFRPENLTLPTPVAVPLPPGHWHPPNPPLRIPDSTSNVGRPEDKEVTKRVEDLKRGDRVVTVPAQTEYVPFVNPPPPPPPNTSSLTGKPVQRVWDENGNRILPKGISPNGRQAAREYDQEMIALGKQIRQILQVPDGGSIVEHATKLMDELTRHRQMHGVVRLKAM